MFEPPYLYLHRNFVYAILTITSSSNTKSSFFELFGVTEHTLRFYTDEGLLPCKRDGGNRRISAGSDVKKIHRQ